ncbi:MAG: DUF2171 domain-containing protein [Thermoleophilia bacterium]|nr:DUF2171 domain-containing protein [Thermoleophilia bacterium]
MADPVSWLVIERGWEVVGSDGAALGHVDDVVGDSGKDIFNGLVVTPGLLQENRYVPAERVASITDGRVELDLGADAFKALGEHEPPGPNLEIRAD